MYNYRIISHRQHNVKSSSVLWPTMVDIMNLRVINLQDRDSLFAKYTRPVPHFITQRYHYIVVCTLGCKAGIYCIDPWAYLDGWNEGQGQGEITFLPFAEVTVTIQRGNFVSVLGTLDHEGSVHIGEYFVFVSCFFSSILLFSCCYSLHYWGLVESYACT